MELNLNITMGQTITVLVLVCIAFFSGYMLSEINEQVEYTGFTESGACLKSIKKGLVCKK